MNLIPAAQAEDSASLQQAIANLGSDLVVIGAAAYRAFFPDGVRQTEDIDSAVALDLGDRTRLEAVLNQDESLRTGLDSCRCTLPDPDPPPFDSGHPLPRSPEWILRPA